MSYNDNIINSDIVGNSVHADNSIEFKSAVESTFDEYKQTGVDLISDLGQILMSKTGRQEFADNILSDIQGSLEGFGSQISETAFYSNYTDRVAQELEHSLAGMAMESVMYGYAPIVAYNPFFLKKEWIENIFKDVLMSEVPKTPKVEIGFERRYLLDMEGTEYPLPEALYDASLSKKILDQATGYSIAETPIPITELAVGKNFLDPVVIPGIVANDRTVELTSTMKIFKVVAAASDASEHEIPVSIDVENPTSTIKGSYKYTVEIGGVEEVLEDTLVGYVDFVNKTVTVMSQRGTTVSVCFRGKTANRFNTRGITAKRRVERITKIMPESGPRINCEITVEDAADALSLQKIDVIADNISMMGATLASMEDASILQYLVNSFEEQKAIGTNDFYNELGVDSMIVDTGYDLLPYSNYANTLRDSLGDLKIWFEQTVSQLRLKLRAENMVVVAVCNPNLVRYLNDINWVFTNDTKIAGVKLNYNFGIMTTGQDRVHVVTSQRIKETEGIRFIPIPLSQNLITFKNYRYSVIIDRGYRNPVYDLVPNIMATQRTLTFDILPVQGLMAVKDMGNYSPTTLDRP